MNNINEGIVFDLHRFSLNDGPGIRTTVFLKGCPLKCLWCHNPESQSYKPQLSFNAEKCLSCFKCVDACSNGVHKNIDKKHQVIFSSCTLNGDCVDACSEDALKIIGYNTTVDEIIKEVKKDQKYYEKTGGGITISGGEPLAQFKFTKELLIAAKNSGIHTCVDTCGFTRIKNLEEIADFVDLFLLDYKVTDPKKHVELTGVDNKIILDNLDYLYSINAHLIIRCPLIPGVNDDENHLNEIANLQIKYPEAKIEIMPYHKMGRAKSEQIGRIYELAEIDDADNLTQEIWDKKLKDYGYTDKD
jgi:glycyl-radical enzyme activating protein